MTSNPALIEWAPLVLSKLRKASKYLTCRTHLMFLLAISKDVILVV